MKLNQTKHWPFLILTFHIHVMDLSPRFSVNPPSQGYSQILKVLFLLFTRRVLSSPYYFDISICSSYATFHKELQCFPTLLNQNGYPSRFVEKCIHEFLDKTFSHLEKQSTASKYLLSFLLPFTGNHALQIGQQLTKLMSSAYPLINLRIIFDPPSICQIFFQFKDWIPIKLRSYIIYKFQWYLGEACQLHVRISAYTGSKISQTSLSSVLMHSKHTGHPISCDDFLVLASGTLQFDVLIHESLFPN